MNGNAIREGERRDGMRQNVGALRYIPHFDFLREAIVSGDIRVGLVDRGDQDVPAIRRGINRFVISRLSNWRGGGGGRIDQGELRGREVIEEVLVMLAAEGVAVFVGAALSFL